MLLGVDTLSYHCRLVAGEVALEAVLDEVAALGGAFVQLNAVHLRGFSDARLGELRGYADERGLRLTLSGDVIGRARDADAPEEGARRVQGWVELARALGSPYARVSSGFYRNELLGDPGAVRAELDFVVGALNLASEAAPSDVKILLENHSDFTPEEYVEIVEAVGHERVGVFLDLINPVSLLLDPLPVVTELAPLAVAGHAKDYRLVSSYVEDGFHRRGFAVQWCYPGEGVADLAALVGALRLSSAEPYFLSIEGLDNRAGIADQKARLGASLVLLRALSPPVSTG